VPPDPTRPGDGAREHLDVLVIGAGLSGIAAAHHVRARCPWATWSIVEARDRLGGTWDLFRYPGIRSDSEMYTLGYSFRPWDRPEAIAGGEAILAYLRETARAEGIDRSIRFGHRVVAARWSSAEARWTVDMEEVATGERTTLTAAFLLGCTGYYRYDRGYQPDFPGRERFRGAFVHPQEWPDDLDVTGRRVVVIGSGATAITLVPALARTAAHVTMLQRSPTWVAAVPERSPVLGALQRVLPTALRGPVTRWAAAVVGMALYRLSRSRPELVKRALRRGVTRALPEGYDVDTHFTPRYDPWDQRLCAVLDGDLFTAIGTGSASVVTDTVDTFTETGIRLASGRDLDADVVVSATGLELLFLGGMALTVDGEPVDPASRLVYKGVMLDGVPNLAVVFGYTNASWTLRAELSIDYAVRLLDHLHRTGHRSAVARRGDAVPSSDSMLPLTSGYIRRGAHLLPKQGTRAPWLMGQSYWKDHRAVRRAPLVDGVLTFPETPAPAPPAPPASAPPAEPPVGTGADARVAT
jgi:cation diffusion facilitator CzcD-associated flavoprotein CzcO